MFANLRRRIFVWRTLRKVNKQVADLLRDYAPGQMAKAVRIKGPGWEGTLNPRTRVVNVTITPHIDVVRFVTEVEV